MTRRNEVFTSSETSMLHRSFAIAAAMFVLLTARPSAAQRWTASTVARLAAARSPDVSLARATEAGVASLEAGAGMRPNPVLSWDREQVFGNAHASQDIARLAVPLDLSGRAATKRAIARSRTADARIDTTTTTMDAVARAVAAFYDALAAESRIAALDGTLRALSDATRVVARREAEGVASGYDSTRVSIESELLRSRLAQSHAEAQSARLRLLASLGQPPNTEPVLIGTLETREPGPLAPLLARALTRRSDVVAARALVQRSSDARAASGTAWFPMMTISGGLNVERSDSTAYGYVGGVAVELPLSAHGQDVRAEAHAAARIARARLDSVVAHVHAEVAQAHAALMAARDELARFEQTTEPSIAALRTAAESSYREGARTVTELIDAQRTVLDVELRKLELAVEAKQAEVALRCATGAETW